MTERGQIVLAGFTRKEKAIAQQLCLGHTNKEIAAILGTTEQVVKNYLRFIYDKTGTDDRVHLVIYLFYHGIVECPCKAHAA